MRRYALAVLLCALSISSIPAWCAGVIKPGLWEMTLTSDALKSMPKLPPEQMEMMRKMGVDLPQMKDGAMVNKVCISKEMAAREASPETMMPKESGCQSKNFQRNGNSYSGNIVCDGALMKGEGKVSGTFSGGDRLTSTSDFSGTMQGQPVRQHSETSGRWLAADCGSIKPIEQMMPAK